MLVSARGALGVAAIAAVCMVAAASPAVAAIVNISVTFLDKDGNSTLRDYTGPGGAPDGILDVAPGQEYKLRVLVSGPAAGISDGSLDVTFAPDMEGYFTGYAMNPSIGVIQVEPFAGTIRDGTAPQLDDIGTEAVLYPAGFGGAGAVEFFTASAVANTTQGMMHFTTSQGSDLFKIAGQGNTNDVAWGDGRLYVVPEPLALTILSMGAVAVIGRRRRSRGC